MQGLRPPHVETIASDSGTWGGKRRSSQFLASARRLSAVLQKAWSGPVPGQRAPSLPGCCPQVTHTPALHGPGRVRRAGDAPSLPCLPVSPRNPGGFGAQGRLLPGGLGWSGTGGMRQGPRLRCCLCFWLTPPRPPHPAFGWTSPVCAPSGEGLQLLPGLALESQDWDRTPALPFR